VILIPEIEAVVILVPRTGSGSLKRDIQATYPSAIQLYRHMEADGVPQGYDHWPKFGVVRDPIDRLWSLYKFTMSYDNVAHAPEYCEALRRSAERPFEDWLLNNEHVFTSPYDRSFRGRIYPHYTVRHPIPENRKSQRLYLRPDLGTHIFRFCEDGRYALYKRLGLDRVHHHANRTEPSLPPPLSQRARDYASQVFAWDFLATHSSLAEVAA